ncbi:hypothetical protein cyc_00654 [Cyclospora cayetanensis]|uniref:Uncharacterized protein n=1 Tax=Cyclospora cayetanensis TaxID=88456 RepID=A0A1D3D2A9_9EIME|nr:hypothetical protein cyc_00654 [Cyclospora cayetanensis]
MRLPSSELCVIQGDHCRAADACALAAAAEPPDSGSRGAAPGGVFRGSRVLSKANDALRRGELLAEFAGSQGSLSLLSASGKERKPLLADLLAGVEAVRCVDVDAGEKQFIADLEGFLAKSVAAEDVPEALAASAAVFAALPALECAGRSSDAHAPKAPPALESKVLCGCFDASLAAAFPASTLAKGLLHPLLPIALRTARFDSFLTVSAASSAAASAAALASMCRDRDFKSA